MSAPAAAGPAAAEVTVTGRWRVPALVYGVYLERLERLVVTLLVLAVVVGGLLLTAGRNLGVTLTDASTLQTAVFGLTFYLCLFGAILATRRASHIAIDIVTPRLPARVRLRVEGVLMLVSAAVTLYLAREAWRYVAQFVPEDATFIPGADSALWSLRGWRWPTGLCFAWMALHFLVGGAVRLAGHHPERLGLTGTRPAPAPTSDPAPAEAA